MQLKFSQICLLIALALVSAGSISAQIDEQCPHIRQLTEQRGRIRQDSPAVREQLVKLCLKEIKEDYEQLLERTEEISRLSNELKKSFDENQSLSKDDMEKVEQVQKLVKKVKKDLRASDDKEDTDNPASVLDALSALQENSSALLVEIKNSTRHSISLATVKTANAVVRIVKFLRISN